MKIKYLNVVMVLLVAFALAGCQDNASQENVATFNQLDPKESAEYYLNAMFIENDLDALKALTHPDQKADFSKSIGGLAAMLVRMSDALFEIISFAQKDNLASVTFNLSMTSQGKTEEREEMMSLEKIDSKWYVQ